MNVSKGFSIFICRDPAVLAKRFVEDVLGLAKNTPNFSILKLIKKSQESTDPQTKKDELFHYMNSKIQDPVVIEKLWGLIQSFSHSQVTAMIDSFGTPKLPTVTQLPAAAMQSNEVPTLTSDTESITPPITQVNQEFEYDKQALRKVTGSTRLNKVLRNCSYC